MHEMRVWCWFTLSPLDIRVAQISCFYSPLNLFVVDTCRRVFLFASSLSSPRFLFSPNRNFSHLNGAPKHEFSEEKRKRKNPCIDRNINDRFICCIVSGATAFRNRMLSSVVYLQQATIAHKHPWRHRLKWNGMLIVFVSFMRYQYYLNGLRVSPSIFTFTCTQHINT